MTLASKCGTSTAYIGQIEIGNRFPSMDMIEKIAKALQIKPFILFIEEQNSDIVEKIPKLKQSNISDSTKDELVKRLTVAIQRVVKKIK